MVPWVEAPTPILAGIQIVVTDVDDTLTRQGRLEGATLDALARLLRVGIRVIPATAASAGWASLMAAMWPVDAVIAENGGVSFVRNGNSVTQHFAGGRPPQLDALAKTLRGAFPELEDADDQPFRQSSIAFKRLPDAAANRRVLDALPSLGASGTVNSLWLLAWPGNWDKLSATSALLEREYGQRLDTVRNNVLYVGDSQNDQAMFAGLPYTVGVSTVVEHDLETWPSWITKGPGGPGFVEVVDRLLKARRTS